MRKVRIGLLVSGKGERLFLAELLRSLAGPSEGVVCVFDTIGKFEQLDSIKPGSRRELKIVGTRKALLSRDEQIGNMARAFLQSDSSAYVLLVDDLEFDRRDRVREVFARYRLALDTVLGTLRHRASVHFLVYMVEAYYLADPDAFESVFHVRPSLDEDVDVETIHNPKSEVKRLFPAYKEIEHGRLIARNVDLERVLAHPERCRSMRTLVAWCWRALGRAETERFCLRNGLRFTVTDGQTASLPVLQPRH